MALCTAQFHKRLFGSVQTVRTAVGVATDDYEVLVNKPRINGVVLSGNLTLDRLGYVGGGYFYTTNMTAGDSDEITFQKDDLRHFGLDINYGSAVLTADGKLFVVDAIEIFQDGTRKFGATRFAALAGDGYSKAEIDAIMGSYVEAVDALIGGDG